jgi:hypothetical protein
MEDGSRLDFNQKYHSMVHSMWIQSALIIKISPISVMNMLQSESHTGLAAESSLKNDQQQPGAIGNAPSKVCSSVELVLVEFIKP